MIVPSIDTLYYTDDDKSIVQRMEKSYMDAITINQAFWSEADIDVRFKAGDQTLWNDLYGNLPAYRRKEFNFNRIRRVINMIVGHQRRNRKSSIVVPVENSDEVTADQFTKVLMWAFDQSRTLEIISQAFESAVTTGMSLINTWVDYRRDPISGDIYSDVNHYNSFLIDPYFRRHDLLDCNFVWNRKWLTKKKAEQLFPGREDEIQCMQPQGNRDGKFQFMPESYNYSMQNLLALDEYWYADTRKQKLIIDVMTGETMEWAGDDDSLQEFMSLHPEIIQQEIEIPTVKLAMLLNGKPMYDGKNPYGIDRYPFVPVFGYYQPEIPYFPQRIQGVVRGLRDAQYLYNRRRIIELDILESQVTSGFIYKENALVNPKDIFMAGQGKGIALKANAQMTDVQRIEAPQVPPSMIQLSELLGREIVEISGVNEELLGSATDDKAGILSMLRQGAGLTTLQTLFDQLDFSQKLLGKVYLEMVQSNFSPGKIQRIINDKPSRQFYTRAFGKYDSSVEEGMNTTTQKQMAFAQLLQFRELGVPVPSTALIKAATLQDKKELIEQIEAAEKQNAEAQGLKAQQEMELIKAQIEEIKSKAVANQGLGIERLSRVQENEALSIERVKQAQKDEMMANVQLIEALKKLQELDLNQIERSIALLERIDKYTKEEIKEDESKARMQSAQNVQQIAEQNQAANSQIDPSLGNQGQEEIM